MNDMHQLYVLLLVAPWLEYWCASLLGQDGFLVSLVLSHVLQGEKTQLFVIEHLNDQNRLYGLHEMDLIIYS